MSKFKDEAHLQRLLLKAIRSDALSELIDDEAGMSEVEVESDVQFPQFSIDHLSRRSLIEAGRRVFKSFEYLEVLTADQNVSVTRGEIMRPDIVCINAEQQCIVMFELKVSVGTGRQALTELIAYEQELKNTLPFLAEYDVCHVLVSPEWSTLLDHSVASSVTWSKRQVLCLTAGLHRRQLTLKTRVPEAWKITGAAHFPADALPCVTVCLYDLDAYEPGAEESKRRRLAAAIEEEPGETLDPRLVTAMSIIAREGDRIGGHGFALLWRDTSPITLTSYNITVCGVAPFAFYQNSRLRGTILADDGRLVAALDRFVRENDPDGLSESTMRTAQSADGILREVSNPALEGWSNWAADRMYLPTRALPILCEFWGALGDFAREYILNPAIRTHRRNLLQNGLGDWRDPRVGLPLIQSFTKPEIFYDGEVRCSDAFRLGVLMGLDRVFRFNIGRWDSIGLRARFEWNHIELMAAVDEVRMLASAALNVEPPDAPFRFMADPLADDDQEHDRFTRWLVASFLQRHAPAVSCFSVGLLGNLAFDSSRQGAFDEPPTDAMLDQMSAQIVDISVATLLHAQSLGKEGPLPPTAAAAFDRARSSLQLKKSFTAASLVGKSTREFAQAWQSTLSLADMVFDSVFHRQAPVAVSKLDWTWMKQGVREAMKRKEIGFGVILLPNGQFVTGPTMPPEMAGWMVANDDPENKVLFLNRFSGFGMVQIVPWNDLETGAAYAGAPAEDIALPESEDDDASAAPPEH